MPGSLDALRKATSIGPSRATRKIGPAPGSVGEPRIGPAEPVSIMDWMNEHGGPLPLSDEFGAANPHSFLNSLLSLLGR